MLSEQNKGGSAVQRAEAAEASRLMRYARQSGGEYAGRQLRDRRHHLWRAYGMTLTDYDALLAAQGGRCAICKRYLKGLRTHIDHIMDGEAVLVRGILCVGCNTGLGLFGDRTVRHLQAAIAYVLEGESRLRP